MYLVFIERVLNNFVFDEQFVRVKISGWQVRVLPLMSPHPCGPRRSFSNNRIAFTVAAGPP